jgi:hypothetical protein
LRPVRALVILASRTAGGGSAGSRDKHAILLFFGGVFRNMNQERRSRPRHQVDLKATIVFPMAYREIALLNISKTGALVEVFDIKGFFVGARGILQAAVSEAQRTIDLGAIVVRWVQGKRVGLELRHVSGEAEQVLHDMVNLMSG